MNQFFIGIDVSKGYADFVIINQHKQTVMENFQLDDTAESHEHLHKILCDFSNKHNDVELYAAMESTGGYENNWYNTLCKFNKTLNIQTARLNPLGVMHNSKADLKRNNTDKISAVNIAEYLIAHPEKVLYQQHNSLVSLRKQWGFINMLSKQSSQLLNQLNSLLYIANPELLCFCKNGIPNWMFKLLLKYPTAKKLKKARFKTLTAIPYISKDRAQQLISNAKNSVASATDPVTARLLSATVKQILHLKKTIESQTNLMINECDIPEVELIKTFVGIGDKSAIGLILEIQSITRFKTAKKLASFWGLHPVYKTSGDGSSGFRMSKQGRKQPRRILFTVALTAIEHNPVIKPLYQYHLQQGKTKMSAIGICMHKILKIIFGMLKNNTAFDPKIDEKNKRHIDNSQTADKNNGKNRRFQKYSPSAPISRRQTKKRMEREQSHSDNVTKSGINAPVPISNIIPKLLNSL